jgi:hypothetical protein
MAREDGYETLMLRKESKQMFYDCKKQIEKLVDVPMTNSQAMEYICKRILKSVLSDSTNQ